LGAHVISQQLVSPQAEAKDGAKKAAFFLLEVEAEIGLTQEATRGDLYVDVDLGNGKHITATKPVEVPAAPQTVAADLLGAVHAGGGGEKRDRALTAREFFATLEVEVPRSEVELWWPVDLGKQPLYNLTVAFRPAGSSMDCGAALAAGAREAAPTSAATPFYRRAPPSGPPPAAAGDPRMRAAAHKILPFNVGDKCTAVQRRIGFRTIEVVTLPGPQAAAGDLKASWEWQAPKGSPEKKVADTPEAKQLAATAAASTAKPEWTLYEGKWMFMDTPQFKDPKAPIEGEFEQLLGGGSFFGFGGRGAFLAFMFFRGGGRRRRATKKNVSSRSHRDRPYYPYALPFQQQQQHPPKQATTSPSTPPRR
jgi:hypothetical protein